MDLQRISDRLEIEEVLTRYTRAIDTGAWDRLDTVFTADARIDYTQSGGIEGGYAEVKAWLAANPKARSLDYPDADHMLDDRATTDLTAFLSEELTLDPG